ncbi:MAG TPA: murein biosynthesis integral membrane protein MurJ [Nocardioides sp.]|nr:murein biosynthesis integral membrane protein MurJ [Nocardioides sp.]
MTDQPQEPDPVTETDQSRDADPTTGSTGTVDDDKSLLSSSAVMAAGTVVSRLSGFVRGALLAAALGLGLHAELFNIANTLPNMIYILVAGGVFNAVLVPQLVRAMKNDPDGGDAYANRVITLAALFLAGVTAVLVIAAPLVMRVFLSARYFEPDYAEQLDSVIAFARYCLPQVFLYGMFVLVGQVLNARRVFGPMMWAPIANNVIVVLVLLGYLGIYGPAAGDELSGGYTAGQEALLGLGSTLGIAVQLLVLVPWLRRAGFIYKPRFDFRGAGLGHTFRLGFWTVLFVIVNQVAYTVVVRLASDGAATGGTGYTVYSFAFVTIMVPHSIVTVSLATAMLPRLSQHAADDDLPGVATSVASTLRQALALIVPVAVLLPLISQDAARLVWGHGAAADTYDTVGVAIALFAPGLVLFTSHYLLLRGFYALERTRTVFWVQCVIAATNITLALVLTGGTGPEDTAAGLVLAYGGAYLVGVVGSYLLLRHVLGGLDTPLLVRFLVRLVIAVGLAAVAGYAVRAGVDAVLAPGDVQAIVSLALVTLSGAVVYLLVSRMLRIAEVNAVVGLVTSRLGR